MNSKMRTLARAVVPLILLLAAAGRACAVTGSVYTTDGSCSGVNVNIFSTKESVFLDGGPAHDGSKTNLTDGDYYARVITQGNTVLGQSNPDRPIHVVNGSFTTCFNLAQILYTASSGFTVHGFDTASNNEYTVEVSLNADFTSKKSDNFKVNIVTPLTITCPDPITQCNDQGQNYATVSFAPTVGGGSPPYTVTNSPASGSHFPIGTTTVNSTVTDSKGATAACSFTVTVTAAEVLGW